MTMHDTTYTHYNASASKCKIPNFWLVCPLFLGIRLVDFNIMKMSKIIFAIVIAYAPDLLPFMFNVAFLMYCEDYVRLKNLYSPYLILLLCCIVSSAVD